MFCRLCQTHRKPPTTARGGWTLRGVTDWNYATELLKLHNSAKWHKESAVAARMAEQSVSVGSVVDLCTAASAKQLEEERQKKPLHTSQAFEVSIFWQKIVFHIHCTTTFEGLVKLQIANGGEVLRYHIEKGPPKSQYTSKFSSQSLLVAIVIL